MVRYIVAVVSGLVLGGIVIAGVQTLNQMLFPMPPGLDPRKPEDVAKLMAQIPVGALWMVELSYALGSLASGFTIAKIAHHRRLTLALMVAAAFTAFNVVNLVQIPHPLWMAVLSTLTFVPCAWLGARLAEGSRAG